jgi:hypothetical protein
MSPAPQGNIMKEVEKAYLAGLIDADGSIGIYRNRNRYKPTVSVSNNNREVLEWCRNLIGKGALCTKQPRKENHSISYDLRWDYNTALRIAEQCLPYLIIKKERAHLLLKWKSVVKRNGYYTEEELKRRNALIAEMKELNRR